MKCKNCGKEIPDDSAFCPYCGNVTNANRTNKKFWFKNLSLKSILVIIAVGIWMIYDNFKDRSSKKNIDKNHELINSLNYEEIIKHCIKPALEIAKLENPSELANKISSLYTLNPKDK